MTKYVLVNWPESQQFIGCKESYFSGDAKLGDSVYFVSEELYKTELKHPDLFGNDLEKQIDSNYSSPETMVTNTREDEALLNWQLRESKDNCAYNEDDN